MYVEVGDVFALLIHKAQVQHIIRSFTIQILGIEGVTRNKNDKIRLLSQDILDFSFLYCFMVQKYDVNNSLCFT